MAGDSTKRVTYTLTGDVVTNPVTIDYKLILEANGFFLRPGTFMLSEIKIKLRTGIAQDFGVADLSNTQNKQVLATVVEEAKVIPFQVGVEVEEADIIKWATVTHVAGTYVDNAKVFRVSEGDSAPVLIS